MLEVAFSDLYKNRAILLVSTSTDDSILGAIWVSSDPLEETQDGILM